MSLSFTTEIEGYRFNVTKIIPFKTWVITRFGALEKFEQLSRKDKEKIYLRWKWGFMDDRCNEQLEISEKATLRQFEGEDLDKLSIPWQFYIKQKISFNNYCEETKQDIGLGKSPINEKLKQYFGGEEIKDS